MIVAVVAFQLFIILSLVVARLVSAKHLLVAAWIWTAFTLVAVFAAVLLVLQLATIWAAYHMLRPRSADSAIAIGNKTMATSPQHTGRELATRQVPVAAATSVRDKNSNKDVSSVSEVTVRGGLESLNNYVHQKLVVQRATNALVVALDAERMLVESALKRARSRREIADRKNADPQFAKIYEETHARLSALFENDPKFSGLPPDTINAPDFDISTEDQDPAISSLLQDRIAELRQARVAFLDMCLDELRRDPVLKKLFWQATLDQKQPQLADAFVRYATARAEK